MTQVYLITDDNGVAAEHGSLNFILEKIKVEIEQSVLINTECTIRIYDDVNDIISERRIQDAGEDDDFYTEKD